VFKNTLKTFTLLAGLAGRDVKFSKLFLTHPPTEARIAALLTDDTALIGRS
jgi:Zn-dependent protease with chaperone function